jgi:uncharacterized protein YgbK (DUF1537 family)
MDTHDPLHPECRARLAQFLADQQRLNAELQHLWVRMQESAADLRQRFAALTAPVNCRNGR